MEPEFIQAKSILSPLRNGPDPYFGITYSMNVYRGCQHACIYCDSRSKVYGLGNLAHIRIKENALNLLEKRLKTLHKKGTIGTGSMNDPYMPVEASQNLISGALQLIAKYKFPVHIITKSNLVIRDIELIKKISTVYAAVSFTVTTADDAIARIIEPGASVTSARLQALRTLSDAGIYCGVVLTPVLPFITDSKENIAAIVHAVAKAGGKYIIGWMGLTQREGQREYFYEKLKHHFPGLEKKYQELFQDNYNCPVPNAKELYHYMTGLCENYGIKNSMEFFKTSNSEQLSLF